MKNKLLEGKSGIITGGIRGIGSAISEECASEGANLLIVARHEDPEKKTFIKNLQKHGVQVFELYIDLQEKDAANKIVAYAKEKLGKIDFLVNNAATITRKSLLEITQEEYHRILQVNLHTPFLLTQLVAETMIDNKIKGSILNISSISAYRSSKNIAHYEISKAGLHMLTISSAYSLSEHSIRVNEIAAGLTATDGNSDQWKNDPELWSKRATPIPLGRAGVPSDHSKGAIFLLSDESSWITGATLTIDGGLLTRF